MPIYMKIDGVKGRVTAEGHEFARAGGATGGVWKTTNFLTNDPCAVEVSRLSFGGRSVDAADAMATVKAVELFNAARSAPGGKLYVATDAGVYAGATNNRGKLIVGVDSARQSARRSDAQGRLVMGTDQGVWRSGGVGSVGALQNVGGNNTWAGAARPGQGVLKSTDSGRTWNASSRPMKWDNVVNKAWSGSSGGVPFVEIIVSDRGSAIGRVFRLRNASVSPGPNGTATISYTGLE